MATTLADAVVRVRLAYDRKDNKALNALGTDLKKLSNSMFKFIVAPSLALATFGIRKYMQTTDRGAIELRQSFAALSKSWDQFLARLGKALSQSKVLQKVIEGLKRFLDTLNVDKIKSIVNVAMWASVLAISIKIASQILLWVKAARELAISMGLINIAVGMSGKGAAGKAMGIGAAQGLGAGAGIAGVWSAIKGFSSAIKGWMAIMKHGATGLFIKSGGLAGSKKGVMNTDNVVAALKSVEKAIEGATKVQAALAKFKAFGTMLGKVLGTIGLILMGMDFLNAFMKGFGSKMTQFSSLINLAKWECSEVWKFFVELFGVLKNVFKAMFFVLNFLDANLTLFATTLGIVIGTFAETLKNILKLDWFAVPENPFPKIKAAWDQYIKDLGRQFEMPKFGKKDEWLGQNTQTTSFAGLNKAAQDMITLENETKATVDNTAAVETNTQAVKDLAAKIYYSRTPYVGQSIIIKKETTPYSNSYDWTSGVNANKVFAATS